MSVLAISYIWYIRIFVYSCIYVHIFAYIFTSKNISCNFIHYFNHIFFLVSDGQSNHLNLFNSRPQPKKKRKSRTAFTNHQIFELEKRFLYQKYLSPADRDEIASSLGLSNAQVITWFQNRRAKLKRDMEELKKDVESAKVLSAHKSFLENVTDLGILKKKAMSIGASEEAATNLVVNASK